VALATLKLWDPLIISAKAKATKFKFGAQLARKLKYYAKSAKLSQGV